MHLWIQLCSKGCYSMETTSGIYVLQKSGIEINVMEMGMETVHEKSTRQF